jgi:membrane-associated phospholipid phosphatase
VQNRTYYLFAQGLTYLLHPALMPSGVFAVVLFGIYQAPMYYLYYWQLLFLFFLGTFVFPAISILSLYKGGLLSSLSMSGRSERLLPFGITSIFYAITAVFFFRAQLDMRLLSVVIGIALSVVLMTLLTWRLKISAHSIGMSGLVGTLAAFQLKYNHLQLALPIALTVVLLGALMSARLYLSAHSPKEVWAGTVLGFLVCMLAVLLLN